MWWMGSCSWRNVRKRGDSVMAKPKEKRPSWFKVFQHQRTLIDCVSDEAAGHGLKAALRYFDTGEVQELDGEANIVFLNIKKYIDEAFSDYAQDVANGQKGGRPPKEKPPVTHPNPGLPQVDQGNPWQASPTQAEAEAETEVRGRGADKPPRTRFSPPTVAEVRAYCQEKGYGVVPERFVDYYQANGWVQGKGKPIKDWKACVRTWAAREQKITTPEAEAQPPAGMQLVEVEGGRKEWRRTT